jgi:hypothetical protein
MTLLSLETTLDCPPKHHIGIRGKTFAIFKFMFRIGLFAFVATLHFSSFGQTIVLRPYPQLFVEGTSAGGGATGSDALEAQGVGRLEKAERGFRILNRVGEHAWDRVRLVHSRRFLPCDAVKGFRATAVRKFVVATTCGDVAFTLRDWRLQDKAAHYEKLRAARHDRHGFVADSFLETPGELASSRPASNDNDGLWTAMYVAARLFEFGATGSREALAAAENSLDAVLYLTELTGMPGYPARSYIRRGEVKPKDGVWYPMRDGDGEWKSDTSSDEIVGHFLAFYLAWELLPEGGRKQRVRAATRAMMDHIVGNEYHLVDRTGKPTTWGRWSPEYFASAKGGPDSPLNSIELMSFLRVAWHVTGDAKYGEEMRKVALDLGYLKIATEVAERREELNYSDEELALLSFYPLLMLEKRAQYREPIVRAFEGWWGNIAREANPLWNTIREVAVGKDQKLRAESVRTLQRLPLDLVSWRVENSWRKDLPVAGALDRFQRTETTTLLAPDERAVMKWNGNPFVLDGGNGGRSEDDGTIFLLPYWMGRYYKLWAER